MSKLQTIMTRFVFRCPDLPPLRAISARSVRVLMTAYRVLVDHGPTAYAEFKRRNAERAELERALTKLRDRMKEEMP